MGEDEVFVAMDREVGARETGASISHQQRRAKSAQRQESRCGGLEERGAIQISLFTKNHRQHRGREAHGPVPVLKIDSTSAEDMQNDLGSNSTISTTGADHRSSAENVQSEYSKSVRSNDGCFISATDPKCCVEGSDAVRSKESGDRRGDSSNPYIYRGNEDPFTESHKQGSDAHASSVVDYGVEVRRHHSHGRCEGGNERTTRTHLCEITRVEVRPEREQARVEVFCSADPVGKRNDKNNQPPTDVQLSSAHYESNCTETVCTSVRKGSMECLSKRNVIEDDILILTQHSTPNQPIQARLYLKNAHFTRTEARIQLFLSSVLLNLVWMRRV